MRSTLQTRGTARPARNDSPGAARAIAGLLVAGLLAGCGSSGDDDEAVLQDDPADAAQQPPAPAIDTLPGSGGTPPVVTAGPGVEVDPDDAEEEPAAVDPEPVPGDAGPAPSEPDPAPGGDTPAPVDADPAADPVADPVETPEPVDGEPVVDGNPVVTIDDPVPGSPTAPAEVLAIEYSGYDLEIFWTRSSDDGWVMGYDVYRDDELVASTLDALSFYDDGVAPETEYTYTVVAVDDDGLRSAASRVTLTTPADLAPGTGAPNDAELRGGGGSTWYVSDGLGTSNGAPSGGDCVYGNGAGSGVGINDANLPDHYDAYDMASLMWVNGEQVGGWLRSATGSTTNFAPFPIANLEATTEYHAVSTEATLRNLTSFDNPTAEDVFVIVNVATNFGSDGSTYVAASSSGDLTFDAQDRWVITDDYADGGDPTNTTVFFGPGSPVARPVFTGESVFDCAGRQGLVARIDLVIPAGERRSLMFFHALDASGAAALESVGRFDETPAPGSALVEGLDEARLADVANWSY